MKYYGLCAVPQRGPVHRGLSSGQYCTDNDCDCQQYDWQQGPYMVPKRGNDHG